MLCLRCQGVKNVMQLASHIEEFEGSLGLKY